MAFFLVCSLLINKQKKDISRAVAEGGGGGGGGGRGRRDGRTGCCWQIKDLSSIETFVGKSFFGKTANYHSRDILQRK